MDDKIKLDILGLTSSQHEVGHFALVMKEADGNRRLPIIIDGYQARAIALEIENIKPNRPMTHDLIVSISKAFEVELVEVHINELKEGIFYAKLVFEREGEVKEIDSRTSDAVAIGIRFKVPIYTSEAIMSIAGIEVNDQEDEFDEEGFMGDEGLEDEFEELEGEEGSEAEEETGEISLAEKIKGLRKRMEDFLATEDYEKAAQLRDEITRLEESAGNEN